MRLILREYLAMLKESTELDLLIPDLMQSMGMDIVAGPQIGVRQDGVDVHGVGVDPEDGVKKNFLVTIKRGDINRRAWDTEEQSVRQSLNEILDVYIKNRIVPEHSSLPMKVIVCCGGEVKQEVQSNLTGFYKSESRKRSQKAHGFWGKLFRGAKTETAEIEFDTWDGSKLSRFVESFLMDENLFLKETRDEIRRTIVYLSDFDYNLSHFKEMLGKLLNPDVWQGKSVNEAVKTLNLLSLCLGMINQYSKEAENLNHSITASEMVLLKVWGFISNCGYSENKKVLKVFYQIHHQYFRYSAEYHQKLEPYYHIQDGICKLGQDSISSSIVTFNQIGILASIGISQLMYAVSTQEEVAAENAAAVSNSLKAVIENNTISGSPCYDGHAIDICLGLYLLVMTKKADVAQKWIRDIVNRFHFSYKILDKHFPTCHDSWKVLIEFETQGKHTKEDMTKMSTLIPTLAYWCAALKLEKEYQLILDLISDQLSHTDLQIWYPTKGVKEIIFTKYAGYDGGVVEAPIILPNNLEELRKRILEFLEHSEKSEEFEVKWSDTPPGLALVASRFYRTPVIPFYWIAIVNSDKANPDQVQ